MYRFPALVDDFNSLIHSQSPTSIKGEGQINLTRFLSNMKGRAIVMSTTFQEKSTRAESPVQELYCSSCWRDEMHRPRQRQEALVTLFTILTLGLYVFFRTFRCCTCGKMRTRAGRSRKA